MLLSNMAESQVVVLQPAIELGTIHRRSLRQVDWVFDDGVEEVQAIGNSADVAESFGRGISWEGCGTLPACGGKGDGEEEKEGFHEEVSKVDFICIDAGCGTLTSGRGRHTLWEGPLVGTRR